MEISLYIKVRTNYNSNNIIIIEYISLNPLHYDEITTYIDNQEYLNTIHTCRTYIPLNSKFLIIQAFNCFLNEIHSFCYLNIYTKIQPLPYYMLKIKVNIKDLFEGRTIHFYNKKIVQKPHKYISEEDLYINKLEKKFKYILQNLLKSIIYAYIFNKYIYMK